MARLWGNSCRCESRSEGFAARAVSAHALRVCVSGQVIAVVQDLWCCTTGCWHAAFFCAWTMSAVLAQRLRWCCRNQSIKGTSVLFVVKPQAWNGSNTLQAGCSRPTTALQHSSAVLLMLWAL